VTCPACGFEYFANPVPAVAALVEDADGRLLLARRAHEPDAGLWDTPGGFLEEAEDAQSALRRELHEEAGVEVEPGRFFGTYVDRYGGNDESTPVLNLVWEARIVHGELEPDDDVAELRWFARDALPADDELAFSWLSRALADWAERRRESS
jgi:ADP-ribose pyrophosphatase YjhB (NUDIX family)